MDISSRKKKSRGTVRKTLTKTVNKTLAVVGRGEENESITVKGKTNRNHKKKSSGERTRDEKREEDKKEVKKKKDSSREIGKTYKKEKMDASVASYELDIITPVVDKTKQSADKVKVQWIGNAPSKSFYEKSLEIEKLKKEYQFLDSLECNKPAIAFASNMERNRNKKQICFDENRIILNRQGHEDVNYINASLITVKDFSNKIIVAQLPKMEHESFVEDFWYMIYQEKISLIFILCNDDAVLRQPTKLFQENAGEYQYVGKMFINNRKTEVTGDLRVYTIEVLPEGCSDSVICQVHQYVSWPNGRQPRKLRLVVQMIHQFLTEKEIQNSSVCVVSILGSGRACSYLSALIAISQLNKGLEPKICDILKEIKIQRPGATENFVQYLSIYQIVLEYIRRKTADKEMKNGIARILRQLREYMPETEVQVSVMASVRF